MTASLALGSLGRRRSPASVPEPEHEAWIDPLHERLEEFTQVSTATS